MRERWMALERGQRQVLAGLAAGILVLGLVTAAVALFSGGGDHDEVTTAGGPSTSSTSTSATTGLTDAGATTSTSGARDAGTTTSSSSTSTTVKGTSKGTSSSPSSSTTTKAKGNGGGTTTTTGAHTILVPVGPCSTGGSGQADQIADLYCAYRHDHGEAPMSRNRSLDGVAQSWAEQLAKDAASGRDPNRVLAHDLSSNPEATYAGGYPAAVRADCDRCTGWAENVAYDTSANGAWQGWLGDAPHKQNIDGGPDGGEFGVGAAQGGGYWWYVQDFGFYP